MFSKILGGILKVILWPITKLLSTVFYGILIRGPLTVLNTENKALHYATGSYTDKLLFDTSLVDGKPKLNFFASTGVLHDLFLIGVSITGSLLAITLSLVIVSTIYKQKVNPLKKFIQFSLNTATIFGIPILFLAGLSLSGAFLNALEGSKISMSNKDVVNLQAKLNSDVLLAKTNYNNSLFVRNPTDGTGKLDKDGNTIKSKTLELRDLYDDLINEKSPYLPSDNIKAIATQSRDAFDEMWNSIFDKNILEPTLDENLEKNFNIIRQVVNRIGPNYKDEPAADIVKDVIKKLDEINYKIDNWYDTTRTLISSYSTSSSKPTNVQAALHNFKKLFDHIYQPKQYYDGSVKFSDVNTYYDLKYGIANLISGDKKQPNIGLNLLHRGLTNFSTSSIVISFYQMVTGNKDTNWDKIYSTNHNGSAMILVGFFAILGAVYILATILIESFIRIGIIAGLFVISPIVVGLSPVDDGKRMKNWLNAVFAQFISIFGVIILIRLGGVLTSKFSALLEKSSDFTGDSGFLYKSILTALFAFGMLMAAKQSKAVFASIASSGQGVISAMNGFGAIGKIARGASMAKRVVSKRSSKHGKESSDSGDQNNNYQNKTRRRNLMTFVASGGMMKRDAVKEDYYKRRTEKTQERSAKKMNKFTAPIRSYNAKQNFNKAKTKEKSISQMIKGKPINKPKAKRKGK